MEEIFDKLQQNNSKVLTYEYFNYNNENYLTILAEEGKYLSIYIVNNKYQINLLNNLYMQIENTIENKLHFGIKELEKITIQYYLWDKYSTNETVRGFEIKENVVELE